MTLVSQKIFMIPATYAMSLILIALFRRFLGDISYGLATISSGWFIYQWIQLLRVEDEKKPFLLQVEGNIGSGKSTFLKMLYEKGGGNIEIIYEPVQEWIQHTDEQGNNILESFYQNGNRWAYSMQNYAFITRVKSLIEAIQHGTKSFRVAERSIYTDYHVFATTCVEDGKMNLLEASMYKYWFQYFEHQFKEYVRPDAILYLKTTPEVAYERLGKRGREEERNVPLSYLQTISKKHDDMLKQLPFPVLTIDADREFENNEERMNQIFQSVRMYLKHFTWDSTQKKWIIPQQLQRVTE
jgi:deoxynucleoside kinase